MPPACGCYASTHPDTTFSTPDVPCAKRPPPSSPPPHVIPSEAARRFLFRVCSRKRVGLRSRGISLSLRDLSVPSSGAPHAVVACGAVISLGTPISRSALLPSVAGAQHGCALPRQQIAGLTRRQDVLLPRCVQFQRQDFGVGLEVRVGGEVGPLASEWRWRKSACPSATAAGLF